ncbi:MAG: hypothetical protein QXL57_05110 [Candidatus Bathyarchaeia archaeon]
MTQRKDFSKPSKIAQFITIYLYPLVMTGALVAAGLHFVNYVEYSGPYSRTYMERPIILNSSQTFTFHL